MMRNAWRREVVMVAVVAGVVLAALGGALLWQASATQVLVLATAILALLAAGLAGTLLAALRGKTLVKQDEQNALLAEHRKFVTRKLNEVRKYSEEERFRELLSKSRIRELPLAAIFKDIDDVWVPLGVINAETGHGNHAELLYVVAVASYLKAKRVFEIGTFMGRTTYHLALATPDTVVTTLDLPADHARPGDHVGRYFHGTEQARRIRQIYGDSRQLDTTPYRKAMDFIWVDADHSYAFVKNDTEKAFEMLAPGGVILWHDYAAKSPGVAEFFAEFTQTRPVFRILNTSILLHVDGVDPLTFHPHPLRVAKNMIIDHKLPDKAIRVQAA